MRTLISPYPLQFKGEIHAYDWGGNALAVIPQEPHGNNGLSSYDGKDVSDRLAISKAEPRPWNWRDMPSGKQFKLEISPLAAREMHRNGKLVLVTIPAGDIVTVADTSGDKMVTVL